jgi:TolA-binding protein
LYDYNGMRRDGGFVHSISSLPMPRTGTDSDEDDDSALGLVVDRSTASSTVSMQPDDQTEAVTRANVDLRRRLAEAEKTLQNRLSEHESELEELQGRLEEMRSELNATKREEKELRSKEVGNL